jgi:uncharacterized membrane protein HdeD (DUF308 family)
MSPALRKGLGIFMILCGLFVLGVSLLTGPTINTATGVILLIAGIINVAKKDPPKEE